MTKEDNLTVDEESLNVTEEWFPAQTSRWNHLTWENLTLAIILCIFIIVTVVSMQLKVNREEDVIKSDFSPQITVESHVRFFFGGEGGRGRNRASEF